MQAAEPLTTRTDEVGHALNEWFAEGKAAGFDALQYENRDGGHSPLPAPIYPSLRQLAATPEEQKAGKDKGPAVILRPTPTIGNSSMSAPAAGLGSIPRMLTLDRGGAEFLFKQYLTNNLFIYPEHQDYDAGANGVGGWGDLYAVNTPCLIVSQGSSHSDMPFVKALLATAAALPPEVQKQLIRNRILCPTLQALFRQNTTLVQKEADYLSGKAHPPVFDASALDEMRMISAAQILSPLSIPPLAFVDVLSERQSQNGRDFFERAELGNEVIATTPAFIARAFRSSADFYEMRVSAKRSTYLQKRPLTYHWVLLQGDANLVEIHPTEDGSEATIKVRWHPPQHTTSGIRSHRVDIGLFARHPLGLSAPAILSFAMLPNERRFFDDRGRLSEIAFEAGNPELGLPSEATDLRWLTFIQVAAERKTTLLSQRLDDLLGKRQRARFQEIWEILKARKAVLDSLRSSPEQKVTAEKAVTELGQAIAQVQALEITAPAGSPATLRPLAGRVVEALADEEDLFLAHQPEIFAAAAQSPKTTALADLQAELKRLTNLGVLIEESDGRFHLAHTKNRLTEADHYYLRQLHLTVLSQVLLPGFLDRSPSPLMIDPRLGSPKTWRDVFQYDSQGQRTGWIRHDQGRTYRFDQEGRLLGPGESRQPVTYRLEQGRLVFEVNPK